MIICAILSLTMQHVMPAVALDYINPAFKTDATWREVTSSPDQAQNLDAVSDENNIVNPELPDEIIHPKTPGRDHVRVDGVPYPLTVAGFHRYCDDYPGVCSELPLRSVAQHIKTRRIVLLGNRYVGLAALATVGGITAGCLKVGWRCSNTLTYVDLGSVGLSLIAIGLGLYERAETEHDLDEWKATLE